MKMWLLLKSETLYTSEREENSFGFRLISDIEVSKLRLILVVPFRQLRGPPLRLGARELRRTDDRASSPTGGDGVTVGHVERKDRVCAGGSVRALSQTSRGDGHRSRRGILVTRAPCGGLRSYRVGSSAVMSGSGELHMPFGIIQCIGSCRAQSDGLGLTD